MSSQKIDPDACLEFTQDEATRDDGEVLQCYGVGDPPGTGLGSRLKLEPFAEYESPIEDWTTTAFYNPREFEAKHLRRRALLEYPPPKEVCNVCKDTDIEMHGELLYSLAMLRKPNQIIEIGTRQGISTKILAKAAQHLQIPFITLDPDPNCRKFLQGVECTFIGMKGEEWLRSLSPEKLEQNKADLLFFDTDPHSAEQTMMWLTEFVPKLANEGAWILFHDIIQNRPEIQVKDAIMEWVRANPSARFLEFAVIEKNYMWPQGGLGLLIAPE